MRNLKKILALALALVMTLSVMTVANAAFTDSKDINATYAEAVDVLSGMGVFKGTGTGATFSPKQSITRAEVAAIIYRIVTGDVTDKQAGIYADYAKFNDVKSTAWYAGYVGYCSNANLIKGDGKGNFLPTATVTGYQALAMILRAMGYDVNGEFTGSGWEVKVASTAQQRGILVNVNAGTLGTAAPRELVAELLFQAIQKSTVIYTPALGYYTADLLDGASTTSLGYKTFGLTADTGIVVGNQATGEKTTKINFSNYAYNTAETFNTTTGLDLFGHAVKVWFDGRMVANKTVYASYDKATLATTLEAQTNAAVKAAGFTVPANAVANNAVTSDYHSDRYEQINTNALDTTYPYYIVVSNSTDKTVDVVIGVDASVRLVTSVNNYTTNPTVTFSTLGTVAKAKITSGLENAVVGNYVIVNKVTGTVDGAYYALETVTQTVTSKIIYVAADGTVTLANGSSIAKSPLYPYSDVTKATLAAGVELTFVLDNNGKYVGVTQAADEVLYVTYAYWEQTGISTMTYYLQGVTLNGEVKTVTTTKAGYDTAKNAGVSYKNYGGDQVAAHGYALMNVSKGAVAAWNDVLNNKVLDKNTDQLANNVFLAASTVYYVITGYGDTLKVTPYTGIEALLNGASSVKVSGIYSKASLSTSTVVAKNYLVTSVLLSTTDLTFSGNYFYSGKTTPVAGLTSAANANVKSYNLYVAGENTANPVWVDTTNGAPEANTYYTYTRAYDATLGADVYTLRAEARFADGGKACIQNTLTTFIGVAQNYVQRLDGKQFKCADDVKVIDLSNVAAIDTVAKLNDAAQNNTIKVDMLLNAAGNVSVIYITSVVANIPQV